MIHAFPIRRFGAPWNPSGFTFINAEAEAFVARLAGSYTDLEKGYIDDWFTAVKAGPGLAAFDAVYWYFLPDATDALQNAIADQYNGTVVGVCTHTALQGYTTDGVSGSHISNNFNPSTAVSPAYAQDSAHRFAWRLEDTAETPGMFGLAAGATVFAYLYPRYTDNKSYARLNDATDYAPASLDASGMWCISRTQASEYVLSRNATAVGTAANASTGVPNTDFQDLETTGGGLASTRHTMMSGFGSGLTAGNVTALYNANLALLTAFGAL